MTLFGTGSCTLSIRNFSSKIALLVKNNLTDRPFITQYDTSILGIFSIRFWGKTINFQFGMGFFFTEHASKGYYALWPVQKDVVCARRKNANIHCVALLSTVILIKAKWIISIYTFNVLYSD